MTYFHSFVLFFSSSQWCTINVMYLCGHKWKCNSTKMDSLFSYHKYRALHPYVPFHFLYIISVCWCYTVSWMQDRYCTKLYCYWLEMLIKSCLRSPESNSCIRCFFCVWMYYATSHRAQLLTLSTFVLKWQVFVIYSYLQCLCITSVIMFLILDCPSHCLHLDRSGNPIGLSELLIVLY